MSKVWMVFIFALVGQICEPVWAAKELFLKVVGSVGEHVVTSREVVSNAIIDQAIYKSAAIVIPQVGDSESKSMLSKILIELMVYEEARVFDVAAISDGEVAQSMATLHKRLAASPQAKAKLDSLGVRESDLKEIVTRKLRSNKFIKYKSNSSFVQVSDEEARTYFNKNRLKFGTMDFEKFKDNIKAYLSKNSAEGRIKDWFEVLRKKHSVKNLLNEKE